MSVFKNCYELLPSSPLNILTKPFSISFDFTELYWFRIYENLKWTLDMKVVGHTNPHIIAYKSFNAIILTFSHRTRCIRFRLDEWDDYVEPIIPSENIKSVSV